MSQPISKPDAIAFFDALRRRESPVTFWSYDTSNGEEKTVEGYVSSVNGTLLDIEDLQNEMTFVLIAGVEFVQMEIDELPDKIKVLAKGSYDFALGFHAGKDAGAPIGR